MTLLSTRAGRHYTESDLAFAAALAERCALAIDNARLHDRAERSLSLLDTVFSTAPVGLALVDRDLRFVRVNETFAAFNARPVGELVGRTVARAPACRRPREETVVPSYRQRPGHRRGACSTCELTTRQPRRRGAPLERVVHPGDARRRLGHRRHRLGHRRHRAPGTARGRARRARARGLPRARRSDPRRVAGLRGDAALGRPDRDPRGRRLVRGERPRRRRRAAGGRHRARRRGPARARRARSAAASRPTRDAGQRHATGWRARARRPTCARSPTRCSSPAIPDPEHLDARPPPGPALGHHRGAQGPRPRVRHASAWPAPSPAGSSSRPTSSWPRSSRARAGMAIDNARLYTERSRIAHTLQVKLLPERLPRDPARARWPPAIAPPASSTRSAATSTTSSSARRPSGRSSSATCRARAPRPPPSPRWPATRCAPPRSRTRRPAAPCSASTPRCSTTTRRSSRRSSWPTSPPVPTGASTCASRWPGTRRPPSCAATAAWRWWAATARWPACAPTSPCTTSTCASRPRRCCCSTPTA